MTLEQFHTYQEQTFDSFLSKLVKNESKNAKKEISRRAEREISMSQLMQGELTRISISDEYSLEKMTFYVSGNEVTVNDILLGQAIAALPPNRRDVILLSYFLNKHDPQIGALLNLTPNAIRYRREKTLQRLKDILEALTHET